MQIKKIGVSDIRPGMLLDFKQHQLIKEKWVNENGQWVLVETNDLHEWSEKKKMWITEYLREQIERGGAVTCAFEGGAVVGFCAVDCVLVGKECKYANLTMLFVDDALKLRKTDIWNSICA